MNQIICCFRYIYIYILGVGPSQDSSDHQDYYIFNRESLYKWMVLNDLTTGGRDVFFCSSHVRTYILEYDTTRFCSQLDLPVVCWQGTMQTHSLSKLSELMIVHKTLSFCIFLKHNIGRFFANHLVDSLAYSAVPWHKPKRYKLYFKRTFCDVTVKFGNCRTPLFLSAFLGHLPMTRLLVDAGVPWRYTLAYHQTSQDVLTEPMAQTKAKIKFQELKNGNE